MMAIMESVLSFLEDHFWTFAALAGAIVVGISIFAERKRARRISIENVGFMPWTGITVFGTMVTVVTIALAIKTEILL